MKEIITGTKNRIETFVSKENLAVTVKSGDLEVFATPMMIALIEQTSAALLSQFLDDDETSVGTFIATSHIAPTPVGMKVYAESEITAVNGREITFSVKAFDEKGLIGEGEHKRFIVFAEKFQKKANAKAE